MKALVVYGAGLAVCSIVVFLPSARAPASEVETRSYLSAIERICVTGVTPETNKAHERVVAALAKEAQVIDTWVAGVFGGLLRRPQAIRTVDSNPHGTTMNFWGPRPPERAYAECVQTP